MNPNELSQQIKSLEEALLHTDHKNNSYLLGQHLAQDFAEIAPNGEVHGREMAVQWLLEKESSARWLLQDFTLKVLAEDIVLVSYQAKQIEPFPSHSLGSRRSSVWTRKSQEGHWQMLFHQATKIV